jgi:hypothetical protein
MMPEVLVGMAAQQRHASFFGTTTEAVEFRRQTKVRTVFALLTL